MKGIHIAAVVLLVIGLGIGVLANVSPAAAADGIDDLPSVDGEETTEPEETEEKDPDDEDAFDEPYELDELQQPGTHHSGAPDSVRIADRQSYWLIHWPADQILADVGDPEDSGWEFLSTGATVDRNSIWLRSINVDSAETIDVKVVYYDVKELEMENASGTEQVATNFAIDQHTIELQRGWPMVEIPLRQSDDKRHVTMWIEGHEEEARWTFKHESVATTQSAGIDSEGDYIARASLEFFLPLILGTLVVGTVSKRALDRAGRGPMKGMAFWLIGLSILTGAFIFAQYNNIAELLVDLPYVMAAYAVAFIGIVMLESYTNNTKRVKFVRPNLENASSYDGDEMLGFLEAETQEEYIAELGSDEYAIVRPGIRPFLSRVFGGAAKLDAPATMKTRISIEGPNDEWFFVHPDSETVLDYEPEGWTLEVPEPEGRGDWMNLGAYVGIIALIGASVSSWMTLSWGIGIATILALGLLATPKHGKAEFTPAPAHTRAAFASALYMDLEIRGAETLEEANKEITRQSVARERERTKRVQDQDETLIEEMMRGGSIEPAVRADLPEEGGEGDESEEEARRVRPDEKADDSDDPEPDDIIRDNLPKVMSDD